MMIFSRYILSALLAGCFLCCAAQDNPYVYQDTSLLRQDSIESAVANAAEQDAEEDDADDYIVDTVLQDNRLSLEPDSVRALKQLRQLAYAKNLDSLLDRYQRGLQNNEETSSKQISWIARFFLSPLTKYFFILVGVAFIAFIVFRLFFSEGFFQKQSATLKQSPEEEPDLLSATADYDRLIAQAIGGKNYRMAIRYHFLQSLQKLALKGAIVSAPDKTNRQYLQELSGKKYRDAFAALARNYEYLWYGEFAIDENGFQTLQQKFKQFNQEVQ